MSSRLGWLTVLSTYKVDVELERGRDGAAAESFVHVAMKKTNEISKMGVSRWASVHMHPALSFLPV